MDRGDRCRKEGNGGEIGNRSSMKTLRTAEKRRTTMRTKASGLPVAPMRRVRRLARSRLSHRRQTREQASQLDLKPSRRRKISRISSSGRTVLIKSWPLIRFGDLGLSTVIWGFRVRRSHSHGKKKHQQQKRKRNEEEDAAS